MTTPAINAIGMDPMFYQYYMSQYGNNLQATNQVETATNPTAVETKPSEITFNGLPKPEESKNNSTAGLIVSTALTIGAAALCKKAYTKGGSGNVVERIGKGAKLMWNQLFKKSDDAVRGLTFQESQSNNWFCRIPNKSHNVECSEASRYGISDIAPGLGKPGTKAQSFSFSHNGNIIDVDNGNVVKYVNDNGENLMNKYIAATGDDATYKQQINNIIAKLEKGETVNGVVLNKLVYSHDEAGTLRIFEQIGNNTTLKSIKTNRYLPESDEVIAYVERSGDENLKATLKTIQENKKPTINIGRAEYKVDDDYKLIIEKNKVVGIKKGNETYDIDSDQFIAWKTRTADSKNILEEAIKKEAIDKYENVQYWQYV